MLKKFFSILVLMVVFSISAIAQINSVNDINTQIRKLNKLSNYEFLKFINKTELIGDRMQEFNMLTSQYKSEVALAALNLRNISDQVKLIERIEDMPDSEKFLSTSKLYKDADTILFSINSKTTTYIYSVRSFMPTITYQNYSKKFLNYYNSLGISKDKLKD